MAIWHDLTDALSFAIGMGWEILWALILGFALSAIVQAVVAKEQMRRLLPDDSPRSLTVATGLGAASSSCSYAAVALARSLFRKGADFTAAMAFQFASTNLVFELGIIRGGPGLAVHPRRVRRRPAHDPLMGLLFRRFLRPPDGRRRTAPGRPRRARPDGGSRRDGHERCGRRVGLAAAGLPEGLHPLSNYFVMDWAAVWVDIVLGLLIAGALAAWVPDSFWQGLFLEHHGALATLWGPLIGPLVAILSFVCSIGNVPLAAVLWNGGISFGGVLSFIFADLIVLPILDIYRKYYGRRMAGFLLATFYATMVAAGLIVDLVFEGLGLVPSGRHAKVETA